MLAKTISYTSCFSDVKLVPKGTAYAVNHVGRGAVGPRIEVVLLTKGQVLHSVYENIGRFPVGGLSRKILLPGNYVNFCYV